MPITLPRELLSDLTLIEQEKQRFTSFLDSRVEDTTDKLNRWRVLASLYLDQDYQTARKELTLLTSAAVRCTLYTLAEAFNLDRAFARQLPRVVLLDEVGYSYFSGVIALDHFTAPILYVPTTFFAPKGMLFFDQSPGPMISIFLQDFNHLSLVEESVHFLHWFYATPELERNFTVPGFFDSNSHQSNSGRILVSKHSGSRLYQATINPLSIEENISRSIVQESLADLTRSLFNLPAREEEPEQEYKHFFPLLQNRGREACYQALLAEHKAASFEELMQKTHFSRLAGYFPSDFIHTLGYSLGKALHERCEEQKGLRKLREVYFNPVKNYNHALDEAIILARDRG